MRDSIKETIRKIFEEIICGVDYEKITIEELTQEDHTNLQVLHFGGIFVIFNRHSDSPARIYEFFR